MPAAAAVFFGVVACVLPWNDGKPLRPLTNNPARPMLHRLMARFFGNEGGQWLADNDPVESGDWSLVGESETDDQSSEEPAPSGLEASPSASEEEKALDMSAEASAVVTIVPENQPAGLCHTCMFCDDPIARGAFLVDFQPSKSLRVQHLHHECCVGFAVSVGIENEMMLALLKHQIVASESTQQLIDSVVQEILDEKYPDEDLKSKDGSSISCTSALGMAAPVPGFPDSFRESQPVMSTAEDECQAPTLVDGTQTQVM